MGKKENPLEALSIIVHSWDRGGGGGVGRVICDSHLSKLLDDAATAFSIPASRRGRGDWGVHVRNHVT